MLHLVIALSLCWGSFLNMLSYRLIHGVSFSGRSQCVTCKSTIAWFDLIPVASWLWLKGSCRSCHAPISLLYPFIELLTVALFTGMYFYIPADYWIGYGLFFSALIVTIRSDLECMLISRYVTLFLIPVGIALSFFNLLPMASSESIIGACVGYGFLWGTARIFTALTGKEGIGQGDLDLLSFIGAFTGLIGCWMSILAGSIFGTLIGFGYIAYKRPAQALKIPFGPFLALGALIFVFFKLPILQFLFGDLTLIF